MIYIQHTDMLSNTYIGTKYKDNLLDMSRMHVWRDQKCVPATKYAAKNHNQL